MIPRQLALRNFLSYREANLNFDGLQVACVSGPNGAGKSSLLEAIGWAIWGQSRTVAEDDVVHLGALETQVNFTFEHQQQIYRVVRSRRRNQGASLEFQVQTEQGFRPLTQRGIRATQQLIIQTLRLDYETFVNSAYLRQGRADEFMLKRPSERKQILADLLKLGQYDDLTEKAKERTREAKAQTSVLETSLIALEEQVDQRSAIAQDAKALEDRLITLQNEHDQDQQLLSHLQQQRQQRHHVIQAQVLLQQQIVHVTADQKRLRDEQQKLKQHIQDLEQVVAQTEAIESGLAKLRSLEAKDEALSGKFQQQQTLQQQRDHLYQSHQVQAQALHSRLQQRQHDLASLDKQLSELRPILEKEPQTEKAALALVSARDRLKALDQLQLQVSPLRQRQQILQRQLDQTQATLAARLSALNHSELQLQAQQAQQPQLQRAVLEVGHTLETLTAKRAYQEQVREKGIERRHFMERLQAEQRSYEVQLGQIDQKLQLLNQPDAPCPVCDRPLYQHNWETVLEKHHQEQEDLQRQIWVIREQLAVSEREIQVLRQEYRELEEALAHYGDVLEQRGHLMAKLNSSESVAKQLQSVAEERSHLERCLRERSYAQEVQAELLQIEKQLIQLAYDERDHALARGQVDRLRWAEIRQAEIRQAAQKTAQLSAKRPEFVQEMANLEAEIAAQARSETVQKMLDLDAQLTALGYSLEEHQQTRIQFKAAQRWALRFQKLEQARQEKPPLEAQLESVIQKLQKVEQQHVSLTNQAEELAEQIKAYPDCQSDIEQVQSRMNDRQQQREQILSQKGALQQQLSHLEQVQAQLTQQRQTLHQTQRSLRVHHELAIAFGRNGLQALLIEHILPQLEAETNHILGRLSAHQLHVRFVTQRAGRSRQSKLIDTLDIVIADAQGTRPYETYSGGEAFRVNFAIRLALARLLAQRSGTPLQMLIIDEGFGTQDREGCDRLVGAINAIAADFACILAVTHIPHFREAFDTRIDVLKTPDGSQLTISV
ncbi:SMC family ATPase [Oscillatoria sp. CS-180]|uniref:exonuclease subunit SbcC n=1 Tax=Oscillatoria sp. CS-180 TaxID=3021720 RepID=UPI00232B7CDE|nr:SMC family ATPase [Oscillatoria sp. CS-180]MDB9526059.1 SMC family ATPase [Oscillatoria sp. CS-180]